MCAFFCLPCLFGYNEGCEVYFVFFFPAFFVFIFVCMFVVFVVVVLVGFPLCVMVCAGVLCGLFVLFVCVIC